VIVAAGMLHEAVSLCVSKKEIAVVRIDATSRVLAGIGAGARSAASAHLVVREANEASVVCRFRHRQSAGTACSRSVAAWTASVVTVEAASAGPVHNAKYCNQLLVTISIHLLLLRKKNRE